ncbi:MAG: rhodanese-like domain-containing protein [Syntrophales bacterium]
MSAVNTTQTTFCRRKPGPADWLAFLLALALFTQLAPCNSHDASAYTNLSPAEVKTLVENGTAGTIIDVREHNEYCAVNSGHIPCALNYPWNTSYLQSHYTGLDPDASYIMVCGSGNRSASASSFLEGRGFSKIYNMSGGMSSWQGETQACGVQCPALYFPHIATTDSWQTEIAIINTGDQPVTGTLRALNADGQLVEAKEISLSARGRREITVAGEFTGHSTIRYMVYDTSSSAVRGYTKFFQAGYYRVAIPAVKEVNTSDIYMSHIASTAEWWTGISLVNTTSTPKVLTITFKRGQGGSESRQITLAGSQHRAFNIAADFFNNEPQEEIESAVITGAGGVIGLELFGTFGQLEGMLLTDKTNSTIYYPHVASGEWWTGIAAYNPSDSEGTMTITSYKAEGTALPSQSLPIPGKGKYIGPVSDLNLPAEAAWFKIVSTRPLTGFELFGYPDGSLLGAYAGGGRTGANPGGARPGAATGVFAKIEKKGWTGIAFVNTEASPASVTLTAYDDTGYPIATQPLTIGGYAKVASDPGVIFSQDIGSATYIAYSSDRDLVGFQLNGSSDNMMLDGLPALAGSGNSLGLADVATRGSAGTPPPDLLGYKPVPPQ